MRGELRTSEALKDAFPLLEAVPDATAIVSADGRIVAANDRMCDLSGYARPDLVGAAVEMLVPSRTRAAHVSLRTEYMTSGRTERSPSDRLDLVLRRADGTHLPVDIAVSVLDYDTQRLAVATVRDASPRVEMQKALERERAYLRSMNAVSNALLDSDELPVILDLVTEQVRLLLDGDVAFAVVDSQDDIGVSIVSASNGVGAVALLGSRLPVGPVAEGRARRGDVPELIADGDEDPLVSRVPGWPPGMGATLIAPIHARGRIVGGLTIARARGRPMFVATDVSVAVALSEKAAFAVALDRTKELSARAQRWRLVAAQSTEENDQQRAMLERMEATGRAKGEILAKVAHELRTPLTSVKGYVELLVDRTEDVTSLRMLAVVARNGDRLTTLVNDLLTMSLVDAGILQLDLGSVDIAVLVAHVRETMLPLATKGQLTIVVDLAGGVVIVGDHDKLERALLNLVSNAVKFTPAGGRVEIATRRDGDRAEITVSDSGPGIPAEEQDLLFTRFFRATRSREQQVPGIGLGLYVVDQIVALHGGTISVASTGAGSTFAVRLPVAGPDR